MENIDVRNNTFESINLNGFNVWNLGEIMTIVIEEIILCYCLCVCVCI